MASFDITVVQNKIWIWIIWTCFCLSIHWILLFYLGFLKCFSEMAVFFFCCDRSSTFCHWKLFPESAGLGHGRPYLEWVQQQQQVFIYCSCLPVWGGKAIQQGRCLSGFPAQLFQGFSWDAGEDCMPFSLRSLHCGEQSWENPAFWAPCSLPSKWVSEVLQSWQGNVGQTHSHPSPWHPGHISTGAPP